ncbi:MAG: hypothetical protein AVDCRST_MAG59-3529, partial [uncultured Thermomicrobiales bacterium]
EHAGRPRNQRRGRGAGGEARNADAVGAETLAPGAAVPAAGAGLLRRLPAGAAARHARPQPDGVDRVQLRRHPLRRLRQLPGHGSGPRLLAVAPAQRRLPRRVGRLEDGRRPLAGPGARPAVALQQLVSRGLPDAGRHLAGRRRRRLHAALQPLARAGQPVPDRDRARPLRRGLAGRPGPGAPDPDRDRRLARLRALHVPLHLPPDRHPPGSPRRRPRRRRRRLAGDPRRHPAADEEHGRDGRPAGGDRELENVLARLRDDQGRPQPRHGGALDLGLLPGLHRQQDRLRQRDPGRLADHHLRPGLHPGDPVPVRRRGV